MRRACKVNGRLANSGASRPAAQALRTVRRNRAARCYAGVPWSRRHQDACLLFLWFAQQTRANYVSGLHSKVEA